MRSLAPHGLSAPCELEEQPHQHCTHSRSPYVLLGVEGGQEREEPEDGDTVLELLGLLPSPMSSWKEQGPMLLCVHRSDLTHTQIHTCA